MSNFKSCQVLRAAQRAAELHNYELQSRELRSALRAALVKFQRQLRAKNNEAASHTIAARPQIQYSRAPCQILRAAAAAMKYTKTSVTVYTITSGRIFMGNGTARKI